MVWSISINSVVTSSVLSNKLLKKGKKENFSTEVLAQTPRTHS